VKCQGRNFHTVGSSNLDKIQSVKMKGNNSKIRPGRVMVLVYCISTQ